MWYVVCSCRMPHVHRGQNCQIANFGLCGKIEADFNIFEYQIILNNPFPKIFTSRYDLIGIGQGPHEIVAHTGRQIQGITSPSSVR